MKKRRGLFLHGMWEVKETSRLTGDGMGEVFDRSAKGLVREGGRGISRDGCNAGQLKGLVREGRCGLRKRQEGVAGGGGKAAYVMHE